MRAMTWRHLSAALVLGSLLTACASTPPRPARSEFEDIPVPRGLSYQADESTVIETTSIKAMRQVYRGRLELESLATAIRSTLEANGWRHVSSTPMRSSQQAMTQVYEKDGDSLKVQLWEGLWKWYTYAEYTTGRIVKRAR
jgi:hypothetical protein